MKTLLLKEARLLLPFWVAALLLAVVPMWLIGFRSDGMGMLMFAFAAGTVLLSVAPFGLESSHGTFQLLLAQPVPRRRIWLVKVFVLAVALLAVLAAFNLSLYWRIAGHPLEQVFADAPYIGGMMVMVALAGGLWTTLLLRQIAAAIWFTPLVPAVLLLIVTALTDGFSKEGSLVPVVVVLTVYAVLGLLWAAWLFRNAQDTQWTGGTVSFSLGQLWPARARAAALTGPRRRWLALVMKELHLHQAGLMIAGVAALFHVALILARKFAGYPASQRFGPTLELAGLLVWFLWLCVPVVFGAVSVAEERKLGTAEGHLCLPVKRRTQFLFKFGVVLLLAEVGGALLPWLLENAGTVLGVNSKLVETGGVGGFRLTFLSVMSGLLALISFYASTLARNTLQALGIAAALAVPSMLVVYRVFEDVWFSVFSHEEYWKLVKWVGGPVMLLLLLWLAYLNFRRLHEGRRTWRRGIVTLIACVSGVVGFTAFAYNRTWELVMPLEPKHGPARVQGTGRAKVCYVYLDKWFVLLPDGRLWASPNFLISEWTGYIMWDHKPNIRPTGHGFLPGSNWVDVAAANSEVAAIRSDGSLWSVLRCRSSESHVFTPELKLSRLGADTNWAALAAGWGHFMATKQDGTLWGWGQNKEGELAIGLPKTNPVPVQIGRDSDWAACFADGSASVGVKRDGSVWKWGWLELGTNGTPTFSGPSGPIRWNLPAKGMKIFFNVGHPTDRALYDDGSLLALSPYDGKLEPWLSPQRGSATEDWLEVSLGWPFTGALKRDGTLWKLPQMWDGKAWRYDAVKASQQSDWIAISARMDCLVALAADGTLYAWWAREGRDYLSEKEFLRPTRRTLGSVNILESGTIGDAP